MHILVTADLHLAFWLQAGRDPLAALDAELLASLDALIVAGDLSNKPKVRWPHMLRHLGRYVEPGRSHLRPGNHDYDDHALDGDDSLAAICAGAGEHSCRRRNSSSATCASCAARSGQISPCAAICAWAMMAAQRDDCRYRIS